jgi:hypothetical protein
MSYLLYPFWCKQPNNPRQREQIVILYNLNYYFVSVCIVSSCFLLLGLSVLHIFASLSCYAGCLHSLCCSQGFIFKYLHSVFRQSSIHITVCMTKFWCHWSLNLALAHAACLLKTGNNMCRVTVREAAFGTFQCTFAYVWLFLFIMNFII